MRIDHDDFRLLDNQTPVARSRLSITICISHDSAGAATATPGGGGFCPPIVTVAELLAALLSLPAPVVPVTTRLPEPGIVPATLQAMLPPAATLATGNEATDVLPGCCTQLLAVAPATSQVALVAATLPTLEQVIVPATPAPKLRKPGSRSR